MTLLSSTLTLGDVLVGNISFFVIFAVLDVLIATNLWINCSKITFLKL